MHSIVGESKDFCSKTTLEVADHSFIIHSLSRLVEAGLPEVIVSTEGTEVLYALTVAKSPARPSPEDVLKKSHHAKSGFRNPWE